MRYKLWKRHLHPSNLCTIIVTLDLNMLIQKTKHFSTTLQKTQSGKHARTDEQNAPSWLEMARAIISYPTRAQDKKPTISFADEINEKRSFFPSRCSVPRIPKYGSWEGTQLFVNKAIDHGWWRACWTWSDIHEDSSSSFPLFFWGRKIKEKFVELLLFFSPPFPSTTPKLSPSSSPFFGRDQTQANNPHPLPSPLHFHLSSCFYRTQIRRGGAPLRKEELRREKKLIFFLN